MRQALILFGHGSRDPAWREPMDAVAERIRAARPQVAVCCAFLELQAPTLAEAARELAGTGASRLTVLPMFLGAGRHVREDLRQLVAQVRAEHPQLMVDLRPLVGQDPRVLELLAAIAIE